MSRDNKKSIDTKEAEAGVEQFLRHHKALARATGGAKCYMCIHPMRDEIEAASLRFNEQRKLWGETTVSEDGENILLGTNVSWLRFAKEHLKVKYKYACSDERPLTRHLENHCNVETF